MLSLTISFYGCFWHNFKSEKEKQVYEGMKGDLLEDKEKWQVETSEHENQMNIGK